MLGINRAALYYEPRKLGWRDQMLMKLIDAEYTKHPFYGARRMKQFLEDKGLKNIKIQPTEVTIEDTFMELAR